MTMVHEWEIDRPGRVQFGTTAQIVTSADLYVLSEFFTVNSHNAFRNSLDCSPTISAMQLQTNLQCWITRFVDKGTMAD